MRAFVRWASIGILVFAAACGGGGGGDDAPASVAKSPAQIASVKIGGVEAAPRLTVCIGRPTSLKVTLLNPSLTADTLTLEEVGPTGARVGLSYDLAPDTAWYEIPITPQGPAGIYKEKVTAWSQNGYGSDYTFDLDIRSCP